MANLQAMRKGMYIMFTLCCQADGFRFDSSSVLFLFKSCGLWWTLYDYASPLPTPITDKLKSLTSLPISMQNRSGDSLALGAVSRRYLFKVSLSSS